MEENTLPIKDIIGKKIIDIRCKYGEEEGWLDTAECFIQLENHLYIDIPYGKSHDALVLEPDPEAESIFVSLSDIPVYHINKEGTTLSEIVESHTKRKQSVFNRIKKVLFGYEPSIKEYTPYKIDLHENKLKYIVNRTIVDYLWENDMLLKGFFELDNGYLITDQYMSPQGTGLAGLHYYDGLNSLYKARNYNLNRYTELSTEVD